MLINNNKNIILKENNGSPFLVDLRKIEKEEHSKLDKKLNKGINYTNASIIYPVKNFFVKINDFLDNIFILKIFKIIILFFFNIFKIIFKFSERVGWTTIFVIRLFYLIISYLIFKPILFILKPIFNLFSHLFIKLIFYIFEKKDRIEEIKNDEIDEIIPEENDEIEEHVTLFKKILIKIFKIKGLISGIFSWRKAPIFKYVMPLVITLFIIVLPFKALTFYNSLKDLKGRVLGVSEKAIENLSKATMAAKDMNFNQAGESFSEASNNFIEAQNQIKEINSILIKLSSLAPSDDLKMAANSQYIINSGKEASDLGNNLSSAIGTLIGGEKDINIIINTLEIYGNKALDNSININNNINKIDKNSLPNEYKDGFLKMAEMSNMVEKNLLTFLDLVKKIKNFIGVQVNKRYLVVFQNNTELRASGGFLGSYALVDFKDGKITNLEVPGGGSYDTEAGMHERILAPEPLHLVNSQWFFWDANWWPDWPTTAKKIMWFYEKSSGPTVDGVISFTPTIFENILSAIGPIDMTKDYGFIADKDNFWSYVQEITEEKYGEINKPKKIIGDLLGKVLEELPRRLNNKKTLINLLSSVESGFSEKQALIYLADDEMEKGIENYGWDGKIKDTDGDYLMVVNTNIAGGKSDKRITELINQEINISPDGSIVDTVVIERQHNATTSEKYTGVRNVDYMRIYVPLGSELLEARGFTKPEEKYFEKPDQNLKIDQGLINEIEADIDGASGTKIYNESGKTVFANWSMVDPGEITRIYIKYKLPFKLINEIIPQVEEKDLYEKISQYIKGDEEKNLISYTLLIQKQPGSIGSQYYARLNANSNYSTIWQYPKNDQQNNDEYVLNVDEKLDIDKFYGVVFKIIK